MKLYKFRQVDTYSLAGLANNTLWFSNLNDFNDPFEGSYILDGKISNSARKLLLEHTEPKSKSAVDREERQKMLAELGITDDGANKKEFLYKLVSRDFKKALIGTVHDSKAVCLSHYDEDPELDPLYENLMWSHYANGLRGFCLVFDRESLLTFHYEQELSIRPIEVKYQDTPITLSISDFVRSNMVLNATPSNMIEEVTQTIGTKSSAWAYEKEFRMLSLEKDNAQPYPPECLAEIVIGEKMPKDQQILVINTAKSANPDIQIKLARLKENTYQLEIVDYESC
ncbi:conserved hypothetical protein [Vibrio coralliirubri]|uniref:DUF2971 domain-containing protein n=1 Tax=Vibrio coralliirubri TaxID=1516159 RepID=UPI0006386083|nr:DUF2971 domain-containing protein [Vibrio coralliirubri]CDT80658.1 conserved hypothetical protein [Vibrio coralliirubri]